MYEPLWQVCEELERAGEQPRRHRPARTTASTPVANLLYITEVSFYSQRPFVQLLLSGVFERHPNLKFVMTEMGCAWLPPMLERFDHLIKRINETGATGELRYTDEHKLPEARERVLRARTAGSA